MGLGRSTALQALGRAVAELQLVQLLADEHEGHGARRLQQTPATPLHCIPLHYMALQLDITRLVGRRAAPGQQSRGLGHPLQAEVIHVGPEGRPRRTLKPLNIQRGITAVDIQ